MAGTFIGDAGQVLVTVDAVRRRLAVLRTRCPTTPGPERDAFEAACRGVAELLDLAQRAATGEEPRFGRWERLWRGRHLETAYPYLHAAQAMMIDLYDETETTAAVPAALATVCEYLDPDDPRRISVSELSRTPTPAARRAALRVALDAGLAASDLNHRQQRTFRNGLAIGGVLLSLLLLVFLVIVVRNPSFVPLCFESTAPVAGARVVPEAGDATGQVQASVQAEITRSCPSGASYDQRASGWDVILVAVLGLIGAALSATVALRTIPARASSFGVAFVLAAVKLPSGGISAVTGILAIKAGFVPGLSALDSQTQILAYSVILGYAQQLATGFLDRRVNGLGRTEHSAATETGRTAAPPVRRPATGGPPSPDEPRDEPAPETAPTRGTGIAEPTASAARPGVRPATVRVTARRRTARLEPGRAASGGQALPDPAGPAGPADTAGPGPALPAPAGGRPERAWPQPERPVPARTVPRAPRGRGRRAGAHAGRRTFRPPRHALRREHRRRARPPW